MVKSAFRIKYLQISQNRLVLRGPESRINTSFLESSLQGIRRCGLMAFLATGSHCKDPATLWGDHDEGSSLSAASRGEDPTGVERNGLVINGRVIEL